MSRSFLKPSNQARTVLQEGKSKSKPLHQVQDGELAEHITKKNASCEALQLMQ
jgi:hypothetical protein